MTDSTLGSTGFDFSRIEDQLSDAEWGESSNDPDAPPVTLEPEAVPPEPTDDYVTPDASAVGGKHRRPRGAIAYEGKLRSIFATAIKSTAQHPNTVPDSAALILYSPKVAQKLGDLAAQNERLANGIDMIMEGTDNPVLAAAVAIAPLVFQLARNHEPVLEPRARGFRIPLLMKKPFRLPIKLGIRLGVFRNATFEPSSIADTVFGDPAVLAAFAKQDIKVAWRK